MKKILSKPYFQALVKTIIFLALAHLVILIIYFLRQKELERINIFRILDLNLFFPNLTQGNISLILSYLFLLIIYLIAYFLFTKRKRQ